ncbi:23S rRNA (uracil(1939)-C(5))-methyltransferase RlmD [Pseudothermotoga thermarum]|uniref:RNA methyltransferase, TrmA family n=1 Tax=Pseudothermotoga thermarum DSM 5069 TaxID=688269 RepID=F7YWS6_9THEM|nr:23S rRNA (uracil(1939)-C(5))-methyltransferase RlmD [Pseudothermotoga thermarum]AEH50272.1 RNA methyltransferase, TrmA family [Pseudothermotoga thermarum DSM 5069]
MAKVEILQIEKIVHGAKGIGRLSNGKVVLVENAYPGELVKVQIIEEKSDVAFGQLVEVIRQSKERVKPRCKYFGICGGCHMMDVNYKYQLQLKKEMVEDLIKRIAKLDIPVAETVASDLEFEYRNKMEFDFFYAGKTSLGVNKRRSNELVAIDECPISPKIFSKLLKEVPQIVDLHRVSIYDRQTGQGKLKHLVLRHSHSNDETMVIFVTKTQGFAELKELKNSLLKKVPQITSIIHVMNSSDSVVLRGPYKTAYGEGVLTVEFDYEKLQIPPTAFFQNNYFVAKKMVDYVSKILELKGNELILDLYAGVGTFSIRLAMLSRYVVAVENSRIAVKAGRANANINRLKNIRFEEADVLEFLKNFEKKPDVIVLDPPRTGADKKVVGEILRLEPEKVVYISCEPSTFARDLSFFIEKYNVLSIQPFDMFPQTYHVECVAFMKRKQ